MGRGVSPIQSIYYITGMKCPHCHKSIENKYLYTKDWNSFGYQSPLITCPKCNKDFLCKAFHEPAAEGIDKKWLNVGIPLKRAIICSTIGAVCWSVIYFVSNSIISLSIKEFLAISSVYFLAFAIIYWMTVIRIKSGKEAKILLKLVQESEKRLQDENYVRRLYNLGYKVPEKYLSKDLQ